MAAPAVRKQDHYVPLSRDQFRERFFARFYDPAFEEVAAELEKVFEKAWDGYIEYRKSPRAPGRAGVLRPGSELPVEWLEARRRIHRGAGDPERRRVAFARPDRQRLDAERAHLSGRDLEDQPTGAGGAVGDRSAAGIRGRLPRSLHARRRAVEGDSSVQGVRLDGDAALPLAVLVLSESCARPDQRLDGRDLSDDGSRRTACSSCARCTGIRRRRA